MGKLGKFPGTEITTTDKKHKSHFLI